MSYRVAAAFLALFVFGTLSISDTCLSFLYSRRFRWLSISIGCCLNNRIIFKSKDRHWPPASSLACALPLIYMRIDPALGLPQMLSEQDVLYLRTHFPHARILNHWNYGGILIFHTRGAIPVFVDGRASTAYPDALLRDYFKLVQSEVDETAWDTVLEKYQIDTVLWVKAHEELRRFLVGKRGWKEAYAGLYASIYVKP